MKPGKIPNSIRWLAAALAVVIIPECLTASESAGHPAAWYELPGFHAAMGFLGALLLMGLAKPLGRFGLYRKENFYDKRERT